MKKKIHKQKEELEEILISEIQKYPKCSQKYILNLEVKNIELNQKYLS